MLTVRESWPGQYAAWQAAAGLVPLERWARGVLDAAVGQGAAASAMVTPPPVELPPSVDAKVARSIRQQEKGLVKPEPAEDASKCRHGLVSCRVCRTGRFA